jgi:hypothetical protein
LGIEDFNLKISETRQLLLRMMLAILGGLAPFIYQSPQVTGNYVA